MNELEVKNEKTLGQRLGFTSQSDFVGDDIFVSKYGTVDLSKVRGIKKEFGNVEELTFVDFAKKIDSVIRSTGNAIKYDKKTNSFYLIIKQKIQNEGYQQEIKTASKIVLDEETMNDYASGKMDKYTSILHNLCKECEEKENWEKKERVREKERNAIIEKANSSHTELTPLEARTYLNHLRDQNRKNTKEVVKNGALLTAVTGFPIAGGVLAGAICFAPAALGITALAAALGVTAASLVEGTVNMFVNKTDGLEILPINSSKQLIGEMKKRISELKINKTKERELKQIKYVDKLVEPKSVSVVESDPVEALELQDNIMNEIDEMVNRVAFIKSEERNVLLAELQDLLNTYTERKTNIIGQDKSISRSEADSLTALRNDVCKQLAKIEIRINNAKTKAEKTSAVTEESKLLADKIDKIESMNPEELVEKKKEIDEMLAEEEIEEERTKYSAK